jgi:tetratricopeptide (TPR) repeat protein
MAMGAAGKTIDPSELTAQVYLPGKSGSLQIEMLASARRNGFVAYQLEPKLADLLAEIAAGQPVIVLENLAFNWYPMWHYAVAIGYDLDTENIILRSGAEQRQLLPLRTFEHTWSRSNYWALVVLPPTQLPQRADENRYVAAASALEKAGQTAAANSAYNTALQRWPQNLAARMGFGNTAYALGNLSGAEQAFHNATQQHPDAAVAFNNLADTLARLQRYPEALHAAEQAVRIGGEQQAIFAQTLAEIKNKLPPAQNP